MLAAHVSHHFSSKLDFMNQDFRSISAFKETKLNDQSLQTDIVHLFHSATPIHYSFAAVAACLLIAGFILMCCGTYFKFPKALEFLTKCCSNRCFVRRHTLARISNLHQRRMFREEQEAQNAFRGYQQGTPSDQKS